MDDTATQLRELEAQVDALTATLPGPQTNGVRVILRSISGLLLAARWQVGLSGPIPKGSQTVQAIAEEQREKERIRHERLRWWELREAARRCIQISEELWSDRLVTATAVQRQLAETMRDRTAPGVRATGKEYEQDRHIPTPLFTPRDRLQFLKEFTTTLLISAREAGLPVTMEGTKRETQTTVEAGSGVDETLEPEAERLAQAGETAPSEGAPAVLGA